MTSPIPQPSSFAPQAALPATFREIRDFLAAFPGLDMNDEERTRLAAAAANGHPQAEFLIGSIYDAAGESEPAFAWYWRSARSGYLPARRQIGALRAIRHSR